MRVVEQHLIKKGDPRFEQIDKTAFASKNLWNAANYVVRQAFIHEGIYLDNGKVFHQVKSHEAYQALPRKVGNQVLIQLHKAWVAFFAAMEEWREHPEKFLGRPKMHFPPTTPSERRTLVSVADATGGGIGQVASASSMPMSTAVITSLEKYSRQPLMAQR